MNVNALCLWGRICTLNGKDYLIASATQSLRAVDDKVTSSTLYFVSQDGVSWSDLGQATSEDQRVAANMQTLLTGDPQMKHYWPPKPDQEDEGAGTAVTLRYCWQ